eukprot:437196-Prymnesium_polylepis.1
MTSACRPQHYGKRTVRGTTARNTRCEYVTGNGRYVGQRPGTRGVNTLRETDGTWDNDREHAWTQVAQPSGHVGACTARRPVFSH